MEREELSFLESLVEKVLLLCGDYVLTNPNFIHIFDLSYGFNYVKERVFKFINERI